MTFRSHLWPRGMSGRCERCGLRYEVKDNGAAAKPRYVVRYFPGAAEGTSGRQWSERVPDCDMGIGLTPEGGRRERR